MSLVLVASDGSQIALSETADTPGLQQLRSVLAASDEGCRRLLDLHGAPATSVIAVDVPASADAVAELGRFLEVGALSVEAPSERLRELYIVSAKLRLTALRDAIERALVTASTSL